MLLQRVLRLRRAGVRLPLSTTSYAQKQPSVVHAAPWLRALSVATHANSASTRTDAATRAALVQELKTLCNSMRNDLRTAPPAEQIAESWAARVAHWRAHDAAPELADELLAGYESAVAIATKQRQFELARALVAQMTAFGLVPTTATVQVLIRSVALELLARPVATSVADLRVLVPTSLSGSWERDLLEIVRAEEYPHHRKPALERQFFQTQLLDGVETLLDQYEASAAAPRSLLPYNKALHVYADNGVPFTRMLELMVKRSVRPDADTYVALLQAARWSELPATLNQLLQSGLVDALTAADADVAASSDAVHAIWTSTMKSVLHSYASRFFDRKEPVSLADVDELKKVFRYAEQQLSRAFPRFQFATAAQHEAVYTLRAKAAATAGLETSVLRALDEYVALAPPNAAGLQADAFLCALELYPSWQLRILLLPKEEVRERALRRDVARSARVSDLERAHKRLADKLLPAATNKLATLSADPTTDAETIEAQQRLVAAHTRAEQTMLQRLDRARERKSYQLLIQEQFERADRAVLAIQEKLLDARVGTNGDLDVHVKLMEQYMTCANRFEQRLRSRQKEVAPQVMRRVFRVVKEATAAFEALDEDEKERDQPKLNELFHLAIRTAVLYWRYDEADKLARRKKAVLQTRVLDAREYELLIFREVTDRNIRGAYGLVQEMHNAGLAPSKEAIHRIVLGVLHKLDKQTAGDFSGDLLDGIDDENNDVTTKRDSDGLLEDANDDSTATGEDDDEKLMSSDSQTIEDELLFDDELQFDGDHDDSAEKLVLGSGAPSALVDIAGFLQDWYNLHGVRPAAKTVVPVLARLLAARDLPEFKRLLQILESMEGGLTPATTVWLEKRLDRVGKSLDDFRLTKRG